MKKIYNKHYFYDSVSLLISDLSQCLNPGQLTRLRDVVFH